MPTTNVDFVLVTKTGTYASGSTVRAAPFVVAVEDNAARNLSGAVPGGPSTGILGASGLPAGTTARRIGGFSNQGFAKNGAIHITTSGTTPVSPDLTNLATGATSNAGDTTFATVNKIKVVNAGTANMTVAPGASNPSPLPAMSGTTPTVTVAPGDEIEFYNNAGGTVSGTAKILTITPTSGGDVVVCVGGA